MSAEPVPLSDHPLLSDPSLIALILRETGSRPVGVQAILKRLMMVLRQAGEAEGADPGALQPRLQALCADLVIAGLLDRGGEGYSLTQEGEAAREAHPDGLGRADLVQWRPYAEHVRRLASRGKAPSTAPHDGAHPEAYHGGVAARMAGLPATDNPYPADTNDHLAWENGWSETTKTAE